MELCRLVKAGMSLQAAIDNAAPLLGRPVTIRDIEAARASDPQAFPLAYKRLI